MPVGKLLETYHELAGLRANFVTDIDGAFFDESGSSRGISSSEDRALLVHLRNLSDLILVSAKSASAENLNSTSRSTLAVVFGAENVRGIPALENPRDEVLALIPANRTYVSDIMESAKVKIVEVGNLTANRISPNELATVIRELGYASPLSEFGAAWLRQFSDEVLIDELCLTVTKTQEQSFDPATPARAIENLLPGSKLKLASSSVVGNNLFTRWNRG